MKNLFDFSDYSIITDRSKLWSPTYDVVYHSTNEHSNSYIFLKDNVLMFTVPGFTKDEIEVEKHPDKITVRCSSDRDDGLVGSLYLTYTYSGNISKPCKLDNGILYVYLEESNQKFKIIPIESK